MDIARQAARERRDWAQAQAILAGVLAPDEA
jgi:hypothetical protein